MSPGSRRGFESSRAFPGCSTAPALLVGCMGVTPASAQTSRGAAVVFHGHTATQDPVPIRTARAASAGEGPAVGACRQESVGDAGSAEMLPEWQLGLASWALRRWGLAGHGLGMPFPTPHLTPAPGNSGGSLGPERSLFSLPLRSHSHRDPVGTG